LACRQTRRHPLANGPRTSRTIRDLAPPTTFKKRVQAWPVFRWLKAFGKQEITETVKFLSWLEERHGRAVAECTQQDVDEYLASGPTTRHSIRTFFIWAKKSKINVAVQIGFRQAKTSPVVTQEQRLGWLKELLSGDAESLPYRVAGTLLLLYAQPLTKIAALQATTVAQVDGETRIALGQEPIPVPEPFASQLNYLVRNRPNLRTAGGTIGTPWLFPSNRPGRHLDPQSIMMRLRWLGVDLLGSRNTALQELVSEVPPPIHPSCHQVTPPTRVGQPMRNRTSNWDGNCRNNLREPGGRATDTANNNEIM
jgi:hypothetical protein